MRAPFRRRGSHRHDRRGEKVTKAHFERIVSTLSEQGQEQAKTPEGRRQIAERLAQLVVLAGEARARGINRTAEVETRIEIQTDQALGNALLTALTKPTETALRGYYEEHKQDFEQVRLRQILVRFHGSPAPIRPGHRDLSEKEALQEARRDRDRIVSGEPFDGVAAAVSDEPFFGARGGDLGMLGRGALVPELEGAAFSLRVGQVSEPVRSTLGYHQILIEARATKPFEAVRPDIEKDLGAKVAQRAVEELKRKAGITFVGPARLTSSLGTPQR
ncbi:MAG TPA: peptidylprolyl isomerase [Bryobacteraceae bacterium]|nr:peptidylprolyl isomerase [Bryobacteraceae bacterium]